jgi:hypothetical protein
MRAASGFYFRVRVKVDLYRRGVTVLLQGGAGRVPNGRPNQDFTSGWGYFSGGPRTSGSRVAEAALAAGATQENFGVFH